MIWITFSTDYGHDDPFVGICHGVIARIAPAARVIDLTHGIPLGAVGRGAHALAQAVDYLPPAVHIGVVDPGVGTARRAVAIAAGEHVFVGPDNGLFGWATDRLGGATAAHLLAEPRFALHPISATFHGRDVFAPFAAHLAAGTPLTAVGPSVDVASLVRLPAPALSVGDGVVTAEVLFADRFGNLQTAATAASLTAIGAQPGDVLSVRTDGAAVPVVYAQTFGDVAEGALVAYAAAAGQLTVAVNLGDAAARLGLRAGDQVTITVA